ncbi:MAG: prephenate dehydratase [Candidatus Omnitrophota bacterium]
MGLNKLRLEIDKVDKQIVSLLNQRTGYTLSIGDFKRRANKSIYAPDRETDILRRLKKINKGPLSNEALEAIYREVMSSALSLEKPLEIAYLGPRATFTHLAALKKFGSQVKYVPCDSISDVFVEVQKGTCDYGVVPVENSIEGAVTHTLDMLMDCPLSICSEITLEIAHNLLSRYKKAVIKRIYTNPYVFAQCRAWIERNLPKAEKIEVSSTTRAAELARVNKSSACIASLLAAKEYGLNIVARDIEDSPHNKTRFLVIGSSDVKPTGKDKTSIMFSIKDRVGALHDMLMPFKKHKINLTKIESRPSKKKVWDYYFFVDLAGHREVPKVKKALKELEVNCTFLKILGSYPVSD